MPKKICILTNYDDNIFTLPLIKFLFSKLNDQSYKIIFLKGFSSYERTLKTILALSFVNLSNGESTPYDVAVFPPQTYFAFLPIAATDLKGLRLLFTFFCLQKKLENKPISFETGERLVLKEYFFFEYSK